VNRSPTLLGTLRIVTCSLGAAASPSSAAAAGAVSVIIEDKTNRATRFGVVSVASMAFLPI
jgi:hypothetical protein